MDSIKKFLKNPLFHLSLVLILGLLLRLREFSSTSFWFDEAFTGVTIKLPWTEMFEVVSADRVHPPLYYVLVRLWSNIFGFTQSGIRAFSLCCGLMCIVVVYVIGKDFFRLRKKSKYPLSGLVMAFALAVSPFFVSYSVEARSYSLICLEVLFSIFFALKYVCDGYKWKHLFMLVIAFIALFFTHYLQVVFVIAVIIAVIFYRYIFTKKGVNTRLLLAFLVVAVLAVISSFLFPIKEFLKARNMQSLEWIPDLSIGDTIRYNYSYFFGVIRFANGVPDMREMIFNLSPYIMASAIFLVHIFLFLLVLKSKSIEREIKRRITFLFVLWSISYFGFLFLGVLGVNVLVERYTIGCGITMLMSFFLLSSLLLNSKKALLPLSIYVVLVLMVKPLPKCMDFRTVSGILKNVNSVNRVVFKNPAQYVVSTFYIDDRNLYYLHWENEVYENWATIKKEYGIAYVDLVSNDLLFVSPSQEYEYLESGFEKIFENEYIVLLRKI